MKQFFYPVIYWIFFLCVYAALVIAAGALFFSIIFPIVGYFLAPNYTSSALFFKGLSVGARYGGVWAGGFAIVLCFIRAARLRKAKNA